MRKKLIFFLVVMFSVVLVSCGGVEVESVTISGPKAGFVGEEITLAVTVLPADAKDKSVKWSSSSNLIATVAGGKVTLVSPGEVTITAKSGKVEGTHVIVVSELVETTEIIISGSNSGKVGEEINLTANVLPENATNKEIAWTSTNSNVAEVNAEGVVSLKSAGEALIVATQGSIDDSILITVEPLEVETKSIEITGASVADVGDEVILTAKVLPENATNKDVIWGTTNANIATVSNGVVTILSGGVVEIFARQGSKIITYHEITVTIETESIEIEDIETNVEVGDIISLTAIINPVDATNRNLEWTSSDEDIATVNDGLVTFLKAGEVTITAAQDLIEGFIIFTVYEQIVLSDDIIIEADNNDAIVGDEINIIGRIQPTNATFKDLTWTVNDESLAEVTNGVVTIKGVGKVIVTATSKDVSKDFEIIVYEDLDYIWKKFTDARKRTVTVQTIRHFGNTNVDIDLLPSVFPYRFNDELTIDKTYLLSDDHIAHPNIDVIPEWVVIHDTGNINSDAEAHALAMRNQNDPTKSLVSWQYTVGNDGVYQSLLDNKVSWHASSGSTRTGFTDTGIPAVNPYERPKFTLQDGYYVIKGIKTDVKAPGTAFVETGMWPVIIDGTYHVPNASVRGSWIGLDGGNYEGIGIETSVYSSGDIWITWHRTAKLVAQLLENNNLLMDRVVFHNSFNNKRCPQAAINSGNIEAWMDLIKFEHMILTKFSNYQFELIPGVTTFLDNTGRVINNPLPGNFFDYTLKITSDTGQVKEQLFRTTVA